MINKIKEKPKIIIAGPGAGKTHDMVLKIIDLLPKLKPNRTLAAITFTNAATDSIREKLCKLIQIPPNIFIGTNYSFFNKYIFRPFAPLFYQVPYDQLFLDFDIEKKVPKGSDYAKKNACRKRITESLIKKGKVPFEQIPYQSDKLIKNRKIREIISNKLQFLLIDEFQDIDTTQFRIFDEIRKEKKTFMYLVGDPEQYILSFTYRNRKKPSFSKIPFNKYLSSCDKSINVNNKRSCGNIVEFNNNFHTTIKQKSNIKEVGESGVFFLDLKDLDLIIQRFIELTQNLIKKDHKYRRLFLGFENKLFREYVEKYGLVEISNENKHPKSILNEALELITAATQLSFLKIRQKYNLDAVEYRGLGIKLLNAINNKKVENRNDLKTFIENNLGLIFIDDAVKLESKLKSLKNLLTFNKSFSNKELYSSIHKAKGLEAECAIVVSKNIKELKKWLETDNKVRCEAKTDTCRIGYVGFTRPKYMLFIACKEAIDFSIKKKLMDLNVEIIK